MKTHTIIDGATASKAREAIGNLDLSRPWVVTIKQFRPKRTIQQNKLMWMWINEVAGYVADYTGYTEREIHAFFKEQFLKPKLIEINGRFAQERTTTELEIPEMVEYLNRIHAWATTELGMTLTLPKEQRHE